MLQFQFDAIAASIHESAALVAWQTGCGKSVYAAAIAAYLFEHEDWDLVILCCEKNKIDEWCDDLQVFTDLEVVRYHGMAPAKREKVRQALPQVLVSTYETVKADVASWVKVEGRKSKKITTGPLLETIKGRKVLVVYDEITTMGASRTSDKYEAHEMMLKEIRKHGKLVGTALTATPLSRDPESYFNLGRLLAPHLAGNVQQFKGDHVSSYDFFGNPKGFKNIDEAEDPGVIPLRAKMAPILHRKKKTDPDVAHLFPPETEESIRVELDEVHYQLYEAIRDAYANMGEVRQRDLMIPLRMLAGHPRSLIHSRGEIAKTVVEEIGYEGLEAIPSMKTLRLIEYLKVVCHHQGSQALVFTSWANSVLPEVGKDLQNAGFSLSYYRPEAMTDRERARDKAAWLAGDTQVYLRSDAGSRGENLPRAKATYVVHYELPTLFMNYEQRIGRASRMNIAGPQPPVTSMALIAAHTIEEGLAGLMSRRNRWQDQCVEERDVEKFIPAAARRQLLGIGRPSRRRRKSATA